MSELHPDPVRADTSTAGYTDRLHRLEQRRWKRLLDVQRPYRWNLRRLDLGRVLDVGCGIGRNLANLDGNGVGIDHNESSVRSARQRGFEACTNAEFLTSRHAVIGGYDSMLVAHVIEHLEQGPADDLIAEFLPYVRAGGRVVLVTPQEAGFRSDPTHVRFVDREGLRGHAARLGLQPTTEQSFPFPRWVGKVFPHNEFVLVATVHE